MSEINFKQSLVDINGVPIKDAGGKEATIGAACAMSLLGQYPDEQNISADTKMERYRLAHKIINAETLELTPEEVVMIRKVVHKNYGALVMGQLYDVVK